MTKDVLTLGPNDTLAKALNIMAITKYGCLPIVDENKKLLGIVTQIDILKAIALLYR
jgi:CBS domain-containing protein